MHDASNAFVLHDSRDRNAFLAFAVMSWIAIVLGFGPELGGHLKGLTPYPPLIVHLHVAAFSGWMILFTVQIWLIRSHRPNIHRKLGLTAVALVPIMVFLGVTTALVSRRLHFEAGQNEMLAFMIVPLTDMVLFPSFAIPGLLMRKDTAAHKRLMLLATAMLLPAAFGRWIGPWMIVNFGDGFFGFMAQSYAGPDAMILAAMLYDIVTRGRVCSVYIFAIPWILVVQTLTSAIYHWPGWMPLAQRMIGY